MKEIFNWQNFSVPLPCPPALLLDDSVGRIAKRALVDVSGVSPLILFDCDSPLSYITWGMKNRPIGGHSLET
jgi:hypothetical protein